jgi:hypothetical protein
VVHAEAVVKGKPKEAQLWYEAARIFAQAAGLMQSDLAQRSLRARYQERAITLLLTALEILPAGQRRAYWQDKVLKDPALNAIRAELVALGRRFGVREP